MAVTKNLLTLLAQGLPILGLLLTCTNVSAATIKAASCSYTDVSAAVASASAGDTINVPAGTCTWSSTLSITKGINLVGAGQGITVINRGASQVISYVPSSANWPYNYSFRVSGFTFSLGGSGQGVYMDCGCATTAQTKIRIDNNRFYNSTTAGGAIENYGCRGVIDDNFFDTFVYPLRVGWGDQCGGQSPAGFGIFSWQHWGEYILGGADQTMYVEDNTLTGVSTAWTDGDQGGSYVLRYNTVSTGEMYPLADMHGGRGNLWGVRGGEIYGNQINGSGFLISQRGGKASVHHNNITGGGTVNLYDNDGCPPDPYSAQQRINNSYHFDNRAGLSGSLLDWSSSGGDNCGGVVVINSTFWMDNSGCTAPSTCSNITSGIGCGTLANRPPACTTGTGYWATNQSCTNLTGMVGAYPATPISGTFYQCTSTNTWTAYFTPYTYPHPLRGGAGGGGIAVVAPNSPLNLTVN